MSVLLIIDRLNDLNVTYNWLASHFGGHLVDERDVVHLYGVPLGVDVSAPRSTPPSLNVRPHRGRGRQCLLALSKKQLEEWLQRVNYIHVNFRQILDSFNNFLLKSTIMFSYD